jgi:hypothetical protein
VFPSLGSDSLKHSNSPQNTKSAKINQIRSATPNTPTMVEKTNKNTRLAKYNKTLKDKHHYPKFDAIF